MSESNVQDIIEFLDFNYGWRVVWKRCGSAGNPVPMNLVASTDQFPRDPYMNVISTVLQERFEMSHWHFLCGWAFSHHDMEHDRHGNNL